MQHFHTLCIFLIAAAAAASSPATLHLRILNAPPGAVASVTATSDPIEWNKVTLDSARIPSNSDVTLTCNVTSATTAELHIADQYAKLFLEPGTDLQVTVDYPTFDSSITFEGNGAENQRYMLRELLHDFASAQTKYSMFDDAATYKSYLDSVQNVHRKFYLTADTSAMTPAFRHYARTVIEYQYVYSLNMFSVRYDPATQQFSERDLPDWFYVNVRGLPLNDMMMAADPHYKTAVDIYLQLFVLKNETDLRTICRKIDSTLTGRVRDVQLGAMLRRNMSKLVKNESLGDSLVAAYETTCTSPQLSKIIRAQYNIGCSLKKGRPVPVFTAVDRNGKVHTLQELKGKVIYLDIWATWCLPCIASMKAARELRPQFDTNDVAFVYIAYKDDIDQWASYNSTNNLGAYSWFADAERSETLKKLFGVYGIPRYLIIDREGNIHTAEAPGPERVKEELMKVTGNR